MIGIERRTAAIVLSVFLLNVSSGTRAWAMVVKTVLPASGMTVSGSAGASLPAQGVSAGAPPAFSRPLFLTGPALPSLGTLPSVSVAGVVSAAVPAQRQAAAAETRVPDGESGLGRRMEKLSRSAASEIEAAADLSEAGEAEAHGVGRRLAEVLTGERTGASGEDAVSGSDGVAMVRGFSADWLEPEEAFAAARNVARASMRKPEFLFAEMDIENRGGVLRVAQARYGFYGLKHETWARVRVRPTSDGAAYDVARDQFGNKFPIRTGARMLESPSRGKIGLAEAIAKVSAVMPGFVPARVLYLKPATGLSDSQGMVYRMTDAEGLVVDVDAVDGVQLWSPDLGDSGVQANFLSGKIPPPTYETDRELVERDPAKPFLDRYPVRAAGALLWAAALGGVMLAAGSVFAAGLLGAFSLAYFGGAVVALFTSLFGIAVDIHTGEHYVTHPRALSVASIMMIGTLLFGAAALLFSLPGAWPYSLY